MHTIDQLSMVHGYVVLENGKRFIYQKIEMQSWHKPLIEFRYKDGARSKRWTQKDIDQVVKTLRIEFPEYNFSFRSFE